MQPANQPNGKFFKVASEGNEPLIVVLNNGLVEKSYFSKQDSDFVKNIKKGIVSLLQVSCELFTESLLIGIICGSIFIKIVFFLVKKRTTWNDYFLYQEINLLLIVV